MKTFVKDPEAVKDYQWDWSDWLGTDTISTIEFTTSDELVVDSFTEADGKITAWISGGIAKNPGMVSCKIITASSPNRTDKRSAIFEIEPQ